MATTTDMDDLHVERVIIQNGHIIPPKLNTLGKEGRKVLFLQQKNDVPII